MLDIDWDAARDKWNRLQEILKTDENAGTYFRDLLISAGNDDRDMPELEADAPCAHIQEMYDLTHFFFALTESAPWKPYRDELSQEALAYSLCPLHYIDYAICFDDDDAECETIRAIFPSHDT